MQCRTLPPLHGHAAPGPGLFFFVVVWLMAQSDPQLLELLHLLAVDVQPRLCSHGSRIVLEDIAHVKVHSRCDAIYSPDMLVGRFHYRIDTLLPIDFTGKKGN